MQFDLEPGDFVINPRNKEWGTGQIQSIIKNKITVNFENSGKKVIDANHVNLETQGAINAYQKTPEGQRLTKDVIEMGLKLKIQLYNGNYILQSKLIGS